ncbi:MAG: CoA pyrophosphatase [Clostridiales Family XIII bacterium]|jgi:8-oxo-dGTP pyrophosphatase MutT (NUDIX family)|nr:CoA pyrophosphatase [Clostridiales Family XIII bacterium]
MNTVIDIDLIKNKVNGIEPGPIGSYWRSSVLLPLVFRDGEWQLLFEVRAENLKTQPGEISFPGGKMEAGETPLECAVRETCEEIGLSRNAITVIGELNYIITYSNFTMYSVLGTLDPQVLEAATASADEVKELFFVPLRFFLDNEPEVFRNEVVPKIQAGFPVDKVPAGKKYPWRTGSAEVPIYTYTEPSGNERVIWGLTARLIKDFIRVITE